MQVVTENGKTIPGVVAELKSDASDFISTRLQILIQEMNEKLKMWKEIVPLLAGAAIFGATLFIVLTFVLVAFLAGIFQPNPYAWCYGGLIVAGIYFVAAAGLFYLAKNLMKQAGVIPMRTLRVLKDDKIWIQNEARSQV